MIPRPTAPKSVFASDRLSAERHGSGRRRTNCPSPATLRKSMTIVVRSDTLGARMSDYPVKSIERTPKIDSRYDTEVAEAGATAAST